MKKAVWSSFALMCLAILSQLGQAQDKVVPAAAALSKLDQPLAWMQEAKRNYAVVKDYSCTMVSEENVRGKLQDQNIIQLKVKTEPFSVHMRWLAPAKFKEQEVAFVQGKNGNKMRVKSNILKGLTGWHTIDINDPRVLEHSRHNILEAGIGNLIEQTLRNWERERIVNKTEVRIAPEYKYNQRECYRIETICPQRRPDAYSYRSVIFLEKTSKLPIRVENYDWPRAGGPAEGELLESFSYVNLQFNTGLKDAEFNK